MSKVLLDFIPRIDPVPPASGQRAVEARRKVTRQRAEAAYANYLSDKALMEDARQSVEMAAREERLRPEPGVAVHVIRGRLVDVPTRREYPYGPVIETVEGIVNRPIYTPAKSALTKLKAGLLALASAFAVTSSSKEDK